MRALDESWWKWLRVLLGALVVAVALVLCAADAVASGVGDSPWPDLEGASLVGELRQEVLPALDARRQAAEARADAIRELRAGRGQMSEALPDISGASLHERAILEARLLRLDDRGEDRAVEGVAPLPELEDARLVQRCRDTLEATHQAEATADGLERQLLLGLRGWLRQHPWLDGASLQVQRASFEADIAAARVVADDAPDRGALLTAAERASADLSALDDTLAVLRRLALVADAEPPDVSADLAALLGNGSEGASLRLALLASMAPAHQNVGERLDAWVAKQVTKLGERPPLEPDALPELEVATARAAELTRRAAVAPPALRPLWSARADLAQADVNAVVQHAAGAQGDPTADTLEEAENEGRGEDASSALTAALILERVPAETRVAALEEDMRLRRAALDTSRAETTRVLAEAEQTLATVASPDSSKSDVDLTYSAVRARLAYLREKAWSYGDALTKLGNTHADAVAVIAGERARIASELGALEDLADVEVQARRRHALEAWADELDKERELRRLRLDHVSEARDLTLQGIDQAATLRRRLAPWTSRAQRAQDAEVRFEEVVDELALMGPTFMAIQRGRFAEVSGGSWRWLTAVQNLLLGSLGFIATALIWWVARRYAGTMVQVSLDRLSSWRDWRRHDLKTVEDPLQRTLVTLIDVIAAAALFSLQPEQLPELGAALVLVFEVQLVRLWLALFDLLIAKPGERRPSLLRLDTGGRRASRMAVLVLAFWLALRRVLLSVAHDVLHGFATEYVIGVASWVALLVILVVLLFSLAPHVRARIAARSRETSIRRWLTAKPPFGLAGFQAAAGMAFMLFVGLRSLWFRVAREGVGVPVFAALERLRVGRKGTDEESVPPAPLDPALVEQLGGHAADRAFQDRPDSRAALVSAVKNWNRERKQGLIAFLGDTGEGRHAALEHWRHDWEAVGITTNWVELDRRLATERDAYAWLAHAFELSAVPESVEDAVDALGERLTSGVYIVRGLHLAFLRTVGGFDGLRVLFDVLHADGVDRCWVLASYRPAWRYLERLGTALNVHLVRSVVDLPGLSAEQLRTMTESLTEKAGYTLDFEAMAATGAFASEHDIELQRGIETYYRLLAASSAGNPSVALGMWTSCLSEGPDKTLRVHISDEVRMAALPPLSDDHLFVLAAIRIQGELDAGELAEVLNMGQAKVRALVRQMVSAGLLEKSAHGVHICRTHLPTITVTLRRRHFVHWS